MKQTHAILMVLALTLIWNQSAFCALDEAAIAAAVGIKATTTADGVVRVTYPRNEIEVTVNGHLVKPFAGLTTWAAFAGNPDHAMVMGDTVVFEDEVDAAMDAAFAGNLEVTALHNHFMYDNPRVFFMHVGGMGTSDALARGVRGVWEAVKAVRAQSKDIMSGFSGTPIEFGTIIPAPLEQTIGVKSSTDGGMVKFTIGRDATMNGMTVGGAMGLTTWAAFAGSDTAAYMDGDVMMKAAEVQPVLRALRANKIHVVAIHNHMINEEPTFYFVHFWGEGAANDLASAFKHVLDAQAAVGTTK